MIATALCIFRYCVEGKHPNRSWLLTFKKVKERWHIVVAANNVFWTRLRGHICVKTAMKYRDFSIEVDVF